MFGKRVETEVLVSGAGPVGLLTALFLARQGVAVTVVDEQWRTAARSYALALHPRSLALLAEVDLASELLDRGNHVSAIGLCDETGVQARLDLSKAGGPYPVVLTLPQSALEALLEERLRQAGVEVLWNHRLSGLEIAGGRARARVDQLEKESGGYSVTVSEWTIRRTIEVEADFVIGSDGHRSAVRRALGIDFPELAEARSFAVFECSGLTEVDEEMRVVLGDGHTSVYWPLGERRFRWSFELAEAPSREPERVKGRLAVQIGDRPFPFLAPEGLAALLASRAAWFGTRVEEIHWSVAVRFEKRLASSFGAGPAFLVGDAAHLAGPIGVHSMNAGFAEGRAIASGIAGVLRDGEAEDRLELLRSLLRSEWQELLSLEKAKAEESASEWVSANAERIPPCLPVTGLDLAVLLGQIGLHG